MHVLYCSDIWLKVRKHWLILIVIQTDYSETYGVTHPPLYVGCQGSGKIVLICTWPTIFNLVTSLCLLCPPSISYCDSLHVLAFCVKNMFLYSKHVFTYLSSMCTCIFVGYFTTISITRLHWSIGRLVNEWLIGNDVKLTGRGWIDILSRHFPVWNEENHEKPRDSQWPPPKFEPNSTGIEI
jgi:hypothetical protein